MIVSEAERRALRLRETTATRRAVAARRTKAEQRGGLYSTTHAAYAAGVSYRIAHYLVQQGRIDPAVPPAGSGTAIGWSTNDVVLLAVYGRVAALSPAAGRRLDLPALATLISTGTPVALLPSSGAVIGLAVEALPLLDDEIASVIRLDLIGKDVIGRLAEYREEP